jgi:hypothetical protein
MTSLSTDFDTYAAVLLRRNRLAMTVLMTAFVLTLALALLYVLEVLGMPLLPHIPLGEMIARTGFWSSVVAPFVNLDDINALHLSALTAQVAAAASLRLWFTRQERMTTLLTHALVLEGENEAAIKVLLHKDMND